MKKLNIVLSVVALNVLFAISMHGQGCSDAGICTINSFKPNNEESAKTLNNQFKAGAFFGKADNSISVYGSYFEYNRQLNTKFRLDAKLTTLGQSGNGISVFGLSDLFINTNYRLTEHIGLTLGTKIPMSNANRSLDNLPLPMDYQANLGTYDLIFGIGYEFKKIQFVAAIQQPINHNNNQFVAGDYPNNSILSTFQSTKNFERSGDIMIRVSYPINFSKLKMTLSILPIYHLANDKYEDEFNVKKEIKGSQGLTLNGNAYLDYEINNKNIIQFNVGMPFIVRDARPDGLTRSFIATLEYRIKF